jgi:alpha-ribazole phosphatase
MKAYHIYLLRHGMTQANSEGRYVGRLDPPLCPEGEAQIIEMKRKFTYPQAELFYASPRLRCIQTLELLYPGQDTCVVEDLAECDFGDYEGKAISELKDDPTYQKFVAGEVPSAPNGESSKDFQLRCLSAFEQIAQQMMRTGLSTAVVVAHGGTIMSILGGCAFPRRPMFEWMTGNGMGYEVVLTPQLYLSAKAVEVAGAIPLEEAVADGVRPDSADAD